jgi:hypothetical protein
MKKLSDYRKHVQECHALLRGAQSSRRSRTFALVLGCTSACLTGGSEGGVRGELETVEDVAKLEEVP